jgi:hypothetical protein
VTDDTDLGNSMAEQVPSRIFENAKISLVEVVSKLSCKWRRAENDLGSCLEAQNELVKYSRLSLKCTSALYMGSTPQLGRLH